MRYKKLNGIILKKQNYREADQIITVWTKELGKLRFLAKGVRKPSSKLVYNLQDFSYISLEVTGKNLPAGQAGLPVLIGCSAIRSFKNLFADLNKIAAACYVAELMLKMTADEHSNKEAFELLAGFLDRLDKQSPRNLRDEVSVFSLALIKILGFGYKTTKPDLDFFQVNEIVESILERSLKSKGFITLVNL